MNECSMHIAGRFWALMCGRVGACLIRRWFCCRGIPALRKFRGRAERLFSDIKAELSNRSAESDDEASPWKLSDPSKAHLVPCTHANMCTYIYVQKEKKKGRTNTMLYM